MNNSQPALDESFESPGQPTPRRPLPFSIFSAQTKRRIARPTELARIPRQTNIATARKGAELLGLPLYRQGEEIAAVLEAKTRDGLPLYPEVEVLLPRRSQKSTAIWETLLGRCYYLPGYKVVTTAQDGLRARGRFREILRQLESRDVDFEGKLNARNRIGRLYWGGGTEAIEFDNGARIWCVKPEPGAFRGEAADAMLFDEAGELSVEASERIVAGALPLMDTRPDGQIIIAGTPGTQRAGLLWDRLQVAIAPKSKLGVVAYRLRDTEEMISEAADGTLVIDRDMLRRIHPGIGTLTTYDKIASRLEAMGRVQFEAEYGCRWPFDGTVAAISPEAWRDCLALDETGAPAALPTRPDRVGLAFDVAPDGGSASLVAAWRDDAGKPHVEVLAYRAGTDWLAATCERAGKKHRAPIAYDQIGANQDIADLLGRNRTRVTGVALKGMQGAASRLVREIESRQLRHYGQPDLDAAVAGAAWRTQGDGGRLFARKASTADVCPLVAASVALWQIDQLGPRRTPRIIVSD